MFEITAPVAPPVEATAVKTKALVFVVDRSGSMSGGRLDMVKSTILDTLPRLNPEDYISIITFDDQAIVNVGLSQVKNSDMKKINKIVSDIEAGGSTNLEAGYRLAVAEVAKLANGLEANIILLSDGQANIGEVNPEVLGNIATAATEHLITTSTIGIGHGYDENILGALADGGNGNHIAGLSQGEALDGLQSEIDGLLQKTMVDVKFEIVLGPDFTGPASRIVAGRRMKKWQLGNAEVKALLGDLASGEERNVFFDLVLDAHQMATPGVKQGIQVTWQYTDAITGESVTQKDTYEVELVASENWIEPERDNDIAAELKLVRAQRIFEQAMQLLAEGKDAEADALMEAAGKDLRKFMEENDLSPRARMRMMESSESFFMLSAMQDPNMKRKMHRMEQNRMMRDRRSKPKNDEL
jgi:Ca-activated chloride channel family protein